MELTYNKRKCTKKYRNLSFPILIIFVFLYLYFISLFVILIQEQALLPSWPLQAASGLWSYIRERQHALLLKDHVIVESKEKKKDHVHLALKRQTVTIPLSFCYIMPKRTRVEMDIDNVDSMFNLLLNTCSAVDKFSDPQSFSFLAALKKQVLSDLSTKEVTKAATNFTLEGAIEMFGLKDDGTPSQPHYWRIEEEVGEKEFPLTPCIGETLMQSC